MYLSDKIYDWYVDKYNKTPKKSLEDFVMGCLCLCFYFVWLIAIGLIAGLLIWLSGKLF